MVSIGLLRDEGKTRENYQQSNNYFT